jgi:hypothetical protein
MMMLRTDVVVLLLKGSELADELVVLLGLGWAGVEYSAEIWREAGARQREPWPVGASRRLEQLLFACATVNDNLKKIMESYALYVDVYQDQRSQTEEDFSHYPQVNQ